MFKHPVIVFEGIETSGKTTNLNIVKNYLKKKNIKYVDFREPGGTLFSEKLRKLLLNKKTKSNPKTDLLLMLASRSENFNNLIKKNYRKKVILIDRFSDSTIAYQHFGMNLNLNLIHHMNKFIIGNFKPDLTILSLVSTINLKKRLLNRKKLDRYDNFNFKFYKKVQIGFNKLANKKKNYLIIDSNKNSIEKNKIIIIKKLENIIQI
tara:strand:- start:509 stop:1129 length:621 start_codon:yes stop_codon:yes gene_type:complete